MEAIRKIVTVRNNVINIALPDEYNEKAVEITILPAENEISKVDEAKVNYKKYYGALKLDISREQIDKELKELRDEWGQDIS